MGAGSPIAQCPDASGYEWRRRGIGPEKPGYWFEHSPTSGIDAHWSLFLREPPCPASTCALVWRLTLAAYERAHLSALRTAGYQVPCL